MRRILPIVIATLTALPGFAAELPQWVAAREAGLAGAPGLALRLLGDPAEHGPDVWALKVGLLLQSGRPADALGLAQRVPASATPAQRSEALLAGARAALRLNKGGAARHLLSQLLWQGGVDDAAYVDVRRLVIESYLVDQRADLAFQAMLRFQQDFHPLTAEVAGQFAGALAVAGRGGDAANWLSALQDPAPQLIVRLRAGLVTPEQALREAQQWLQPDPPAAPVGVARGRRPLPPVVSPPSRPRPQQPELAVLAVQMHAAEVAGSRSLAAQARERLLDAAARPADPLLTARPEHLWADYRELARERANEAHLLQGDEAAWLRLAESLPAGESLTSRALLVHLLASRDASLRARAETLLLEQLRQNKLERLAVRLLASEAARLGPDGRLLLGEWAAQLQEPKLAALYWRGLAPPDGRNPHEWRLEKARVLLAGGEAEAAAADLREWLPGRAELEPARAEALLPLLEQMADTGWGGLAEPLLQWFVSRAPLASRAAAHEILARIFHARGLPGVAAWHSLAAARDPDRSGRARRVAVEHLLRAGLREDAIEVLRRVVADERDPAQRAAARRLLATLE